MKKMDNIQYKGFIYYISNSVNTKGYIGQTIRTPHQRFLQHLTAARNNTDDYLLHKAIRDIGDKFFKVEVLEEVRSTSVEELKRQLDCLEKYWIKERKTQVPYGYNMQGGGQGITPKPVKLYDYNGKLIKTYVSIDYASSELCIASSAISNNCRGITQGTRVGVFRYLDNEFDDYPHTYMPDGAIRIVAYSFIGEPIKEYDSIAEFSSDYGVTKTSGTRYLKNHYLVDYKFVLFKENEPFQEDKITFPEYKPILRITSNNEYIFYPNASIAARDCNIDPSTIIKCCRKKRKEIKGNTFLYAPEKEYIKILLTEGISNEKKIINIG